MSHVDGKTGASGAQRRAIAVILVAFVFIVFVIYLSVRSFAPSSVVAPPKSAGAIAATSSSAEEIRASNERAAALRRLSAATSTYEALLADCASVGALSIPQLANDLCRAAHAQATRDYVKLHKYLEASAALNAAVNEGLDHAAVEPLRRAIEAGMERERERAKEEQENADQLERVGYGVLLRERFLDKGMDVKVSVAGRRKDRIADLGSHERCMDAPNGEAQRHRR